jgi:hypothetical protein
MRFLVKLRVLLVARRGVFVECHVGLGRVRGVVARDVVFGLDVSEADPCRGQTGNRIIDVSDAEVASWSGVLDVGCYGCETDLGGAICVLLYWLGYVFRQLGQ